MHMLMLAYSRQVGRNWQVDLAAGAVRTDFAGIRVVQLDPVVAELLGQTTGREAFNTINQLPAFQLSFSRRFRRSFFSMGYNEGASPGNGVLLASRQKSASVGYTYNGSTRWSASVSASYLRMKGLGGAAGTYAGFTGTANFNYRFWNDLNFTFSTAARQLSIASSDFSRVGTNVSIGLSYAPGAFPLAFR